MTDNFAQQQNGDRYIIGIRFQRAGKIYHFDASNYRNLVPGDFVIVETSRGFQLGQMIFVVENIDLHLNGGIKPVLRQATAQDLIQKQYWEQKGADALNSCQEKADELGYSDVKIIAAEFSFDGSRLNFLYSCEEGEKTDLKSLRRSMQRLFSQTHIDIHLIGPRDVAKMMGGMGACGLEIRCCSAFLQDFSPISIKMAKEQGISLTPTEITGMCGRLRCCLVYEYEQYAEARKLLPKRGKRVSTSMGEGKVVELLALQSAVVVELDSGGQHEFSSQDIKISDEQDLPRKRAMDVDDSRVNQVKPISTQHKPRGNG